MKTLPIFLALVLSGCMTLPSGETVVDYDRVARVAGRVAYVGAHFDLKANPGHLDAYKQAVEGLRVLEATSEPDGAALSQALASLSVIKRLEDDKAILAIEFGDWFLEELSQVRVKFISVGVVKKVAPQIRAGLERAVAEVKSI